MIRLKCKKAGKIRKKDLITGEIKETLGSGLKRSQTYTSPGLTISEEGWLCYVINEIEGDIKLAERFREIPADQVTKVMVKSLKPEPVWEMA